MSHYGYPCVCPPWSLLSFLDMQILVQIGGVVGAIITSDVLSVCFSMSSLLGLLWWVYLYVWWCPIGISFSVPSSFFSPPWVILIICLQVCYFFLLPTQICYWNLLLNFSFLFLYSLGSEFLLGSFLYFLCLFWYSLFVETSFYLFSLSLCLWFPWTLLAYYVSWFKIFASYVQCLCFLKDSLCWFHSWIGYTFYFSLYTAYFCEKLDIWIL